MANRRPAKDHSPIDRVVVFVSEPIQWLVVSAIDTATEIWDGYVALIHVEADNVELRAENARLRAALAATQEDRLENERLRLLVGLRERSSAITTRSARVVATSPSPLFRSIRIDSGRADGVRVGATVVSFDGVVGRVAAVAEHSSDIMLLVDANSSTDVLVQRTRARARVRGQGGDTSMGIELQYLSRTADVEPGDLLITSGVGSIFPKGLRIGRVVAVERPAFGLYQRAEVEPSVDFRRLEEVMVILPGWPADTSLEVDPRGAISVGASGTQAAAAGDRLGQARQAPRTAAMHESQPGSRLIQP